MSESTITTAGSLYKKKWYESELEFSPKNPYT